MDHFGYSEALLHVFHIKVINLPKFIGPSHYQVVIPPGLAEASPYQKSCAVDGSENDWKF